MKKIVTLTLMLAIAHVACAQDEVEGPIRDEKSTKILKELSDKADSYQSVQATFTKKFYKQGDLKSTTQGKVVVKKEMFFLETGEGQDIYSDGKTVWTHIIDENVVYKCPASEVLDDDISNPRELLTIWEQDFKSRYVKEEVKGDKRYHVIYLHPIKRAGKKYHTIILKIDADQMEVKHFVIKSNDGSRTLITIDTFDTNQTIDDARFRWRNRPGVDVEEDC